MAYYISQGRVETPIRRWAILLQFCCKFTSASVRQKLLKYNVVLQSYCKNRRVQFLPRSVEWLCWRVVKKDYDNILSGLHRIPERDGWTDGQTDRRTELLYQYSASVCWRAIKRVCENASRFTIVKIPTFSEKREILNPNPCGAGSCFGLSTPEPGIPTTIVDTTLLKGVPAVFNF